MGSQFGYRYHHEFLMVHEDEIKSHCKKIMKPGLRGFLFEFRTNFILQTSGEGGIIDQILDMETFDACVHSSDEDDTELDSLHSMIVYRLEEYWMPTGEIISLLKDALAFANQKASEPKCTSLSVIPIVVHLYVYTVQQEGESFNVAMDRAITARNLDPMYLWQEPTAVEHKPVSAWFWIFLRKLERVRVEDVDEGLGLMPVGCGICKRRPSIGTQISPLACDHAFHSHCIIRWLEGSNECPTCGVQVYCQSIFDDPPIIAFGC